MTAERIEWYDSAMLSAATGTLAQVGSNIHTDEDYARSQGLPAVIADGMIMTNWVLEHAGRAISAWTTSSAANCAPSSSSPSYSA